MFVRARGCVCLKIDHAMSNSCTSIRHPHGEMQLFRFKKTKQNTQFQYRISSSTSTIAVVNCTQQYVLPDVLLVERSCPVFIVLWDEDCVHFLPSHRNHIDTIPVNTCVICKIYVQCAVCLTKFIDLPWAVASVSSCGLPLSHTLLQYNIGDNQQYTTELNERKKMHK